MHVNRSGGISRVSSRALSPPRTNLHGAMVGSFCPSPHTISGGQNGVIRCQGFAARQRLLLSRTRTQTNVPIHFPSTSPHRSLHLRHHMHPHPCAITHEGGEYPGGNSSSDVPIFSSASLTPPPPPRIVIRQANVEDCPRIAEIILAVRRLFSWENYYYSDYFFGL